MSSHAGFLLPRTHPLSLNLGFHLTSLPDIMEVDLQAGLYTTFLKRMVSFLERDVRILE